MTCTLLPLPLLLVGWYALWFWTCEDANDAGDEEGEEEGESSVERCEGDKERLVSGDERGG